MSGYNWVPRPLHSFASLLLHLVPPPPPHGGIFLPIAPVTMTPPSFHGQVGAAAGVRKTGTVDSGRAFGGDHGGLGVALGRGCVRSVSFHRRVAALDPQLCSPPQQGHACARLAPRRAAPLGAQVGTRSKASGAVLTSPPGGSELGPAAPATLAQISLLWVLPPLLLLFRLPNYQAKVAVWLALFFVCERPLKTQPPSLFNIGWGHLPLMPPCPHPHVIGNR